MNITKVFYAGKCIMVIDMDYVQEDDIYEYLNEIIGSFKERAYKEFDLENKYESEARKVWEGNEDLYELMIKTEEQVDREIEVKEFEDLFEKMDLLMNRMKEELNEEKFELFITLRNKYVKTLNDLENEFYAGNGCLDYVWEERIIK